MKTCPYCAEQVQDAAVVCRFCGRDLSAPVGAVTDAERSEIVDHAIRHHSKGPVNRIENRTPFTATIVFGGNVNHVAHFLIGFLTFGLWWFVWLLVALSDREQRMEIAVDHNGVVQTRSVQTNRVLETYDGRGWLPRFAGDMQAQLAQAEAARAAAEAERLAAYQTPEAVARRRRRLTLVVAAAALLFAGVLATLFVADRYAAQEKRATAEREAALGAARVAHLTAPRLSVLRHAATPGRGGRTVVAGDVRNTWDAALVDIEAVLTWTDAAGASLDTSSGRVGAYVIGVGDDASFAVETRRPAKAMGYVLEFREGKGAPFTSVTADLSVVPAR